MNWNVKRFSMLNISQVILIRTDSNLCRKELTVHWSAPNSLIRSYLQPCTNSMWGDESEAVAPIIRLYQIVDAQKEEVFFPELLITLRSYGYSRIPGTPKTHGNQLVPRRVCGWWTRGSKTREGRRQGLCIQSRFGWHNNGRDVLHLCSIGRPGAIGHGWWLVDDIHQRLARSSMSDLFHWILWQPPNLVVFVEPQTRVCSLDVAANEVDMAWLVLTPPTASGVVFPKFMLTQEVSLREHLATVWASV